MIIYKPRKMVCRIPGKEKTGFFAAKTAGTTIDTNDLCKRISEKCSVSGSDVKGVIEALINEFELELLSGNRIRMGELGLFEASITSEVVTETEALKPKKVRIKTVTFLPSPRLKSMMGKANFMRLRDFNKMVNGVEEE
ncbi:HU family DNA-binding protein [Parabacteroides sp. PF5-9]|uniref:HU family DNA-binding protein n=1 Tax=Parabacteroides sp. PF5-9 TaxID=1742404 RepID=UPI0024744215|nr:HU family DNA-binding protein [Parabacteroides sp. PF5-9]MDH6359167.1 putative histone-like DNA-binding protein [Parabacteroides sp. PF5-9]